MGEMLVQDPAVRRWSLGGSDVGAVLGLCPWATPLDLWRTKVYGYGAPDSPALRRGRDLERVVAALYRERLGLPPRAGATGTRLSGAPLGWPELTGSPDLVLKRGKGRPWIAEFKTALRRSPDWGDDGEPRVPAHYLAQALHYLALEPSASHVDLVLLDLTRWRISIHPILAGPHQEVISTQVAAVRAWWARHVAPALDAERAGQPLGPDEILALAPGEPGRTIVMGEGDALATGADYDLLQAYRQAKAEADAAGEALDAAKSALEARMREAGVSRLVSQSGETLATRTVFTRETVDLKALTAAHPELVKAFRVQSEASRITVKWKGDVT